MALRLLSTELQAIAAHELNEKPEELNSSIDFIRTWVKRTKYLKARTDDQWIAQFLRAEKHNIERTMKRIDTFYGIRSTASDLFANRDPFDPDIQEVLKLGTVLPLPASEGSPRIILTRNPRKSLIYSGELVYKVHSMVEDILVAEDDNSVICGSYYLVDLENTTRDYYFPLIKNGTMKRCLYFIESGIPINFKRVHVFNVPEKARRTVNLVQSFKSQKCRNRTQLHKNVEELCNYIPRNSLPREYGGNGPSILELAAEWKSKVESYSEWFKEEDSYGIIESLRPNKIIFPDKTGMIGLSSEELQFCASCFI